MQTCYPYLWLSGGLGSELESLWGLFGPVNQKCGVLEPAGKTDQSCEDEDMVVAGSFVGH